MLCFELNELVCFGLFLLKIIHVQLLLFFKKNYIVKRR